MSVKSSTSRFFRKSVGAVLRKVSSSTPPQPSISCSQLNPAIEALKKQPLGPSLSWDPGEQLRYVLFKFFRL
jgi:hypothetical protein